MFAGWHSFTAPACFV